MRERFNTVAVAIPAQQFSVRCHVSIDRQVPVMTDFAVRLLHLSGPLEPTALREYFGLTSSEIRDLLELLREEGLVGEANGRISLTSYAEARFTAAGDGMPRFTRIAERQSRPIFELLTYTPLPRTVSGSFWDNALDLKWETDAEAPGRTIESAEAAFHKHFVDIERLEYDEPRRRAYSCYKVDDIRAGRPFNVPLPVHFEVDVDGNVDFELDAALELLPEDLRSQVRVLTADRIGSLPVRSMYLRAFVEHYQDDLLSRFLMSPQSDDKTSVITVAGRLTLRRDPVVDFGRYVRDVHGSADGEVYEDGQSQALLGGLYMPKSQERVLNGLRRALARYKTAKVGTNLVDPPAVLWVIPDSDLWGRTALVRETLDNLRVALKEGLGDTPDIVCVAPCTQDEHRDRLGKRARLLLAGGFSRVVFAPYRVAQESFEALLVPGVYGAAMYHWTVPTADRYSVPLGFCSSSPIKLQKMAVFVRGVLASALHSVGRGSAETTGDRWFKDASVADFAFLDTFTKS